VSLEKAFRQIAANLSDEFEVDFQQVPYGNRVFDTIRNLLFFRKKNADIYHQTGHIQYIVLRLPRRNTVLSIMDVRYLYIQRGLRRWVLKKLYLDWPIKKLKYITAISEHTKDEIIRFNGCREEKIAVLDLPLVVKIDEEPPSTFNKQRPTILQVGTMDNKNIPNLARALSGIPCKVRIIGNMTGAQRKILHECEVEYENETNLTDEQVRNAYRSADLVSFCSTFEGFGLPIIEAQSMQKPVITSNVSPMIETSGGAAFLADPFDVQSIRGGIEKIIQDDAYRESLVTAGLRNVRRFDPAIVARQYETLYKAILSDNRS